MIKKKNLNRPAEFTSETVTIVTEPEPTNKDFDTFGIEEIEEETSPEMQSFTHQKRMKDAILKQLQEQMQMFTDYAPFNFKNQESLATYFQISDVLSKVLGKKNSGIIMEKDEFMPSLLQVVGASKQFMQMLKDNHFN